MPYAIQDDTGKIIALYENQDDINAQWLDEDDVRVVDFHRSSGISDKALQDLVLSDMEFIRVLEDVVELLIKKQVFAFTELPLSAQIKLSKRQKIRNDMISLSSLVDNDEEGIF